MEARKCTGDKAASATPASRPTGKGGSLAFRRWLERLLLVVGLGLIGFYVAARIHGAVLSKFAVRRFEHLKQVAPGNHFPGNAASSGLSDEQAGTTSQPEHVLWSKERIKDYQNSLGQNLAAPLAILRIPMIHLEVPVLEGTDDLTLNRGVGRIEDTAQIGEDGNIGIAGHRDGFFRGLKDLKVGDTLELEGPARTDTYVVDQLRIVNPNDVSILQPRSRSSVTLVTCYPFYFIGSAPQRYIVHAARTDSEPQKNTTTEQGSLTPQTYNQENTQ